MTSKSTGDQDSGSRLDGEIRTFAARGLGLLSMAGSSIGCYFAISEPIEFWLLFTFFSPMFLVGLVLIIVPRRTFIRLCNVFVVCWYPLWAWYWLFFVAK
jgi:hypothetical protein